MTYLLEILQAQRADPASYWTLCQWTALSSQTLLDLPYIRETSFPRSHTLSRAVSIQWLEATAFKCLIPCPQFGTCEKDHPSCIAPQRISRNLLEDCIKLQLLRSPQACFLPLLSVGGSSKSSLHRHYVRMVSLLVNTAWDTPVSTREWTETAVEQCDGPLRCRKWQTSTSEKSGR